MKTNSIATLSLLCASFGTAQAFNTIFHEPFDALAGESISLFAPVGDGGKGWAVHHSFQGNLNPGGVGITTLAGRLGAPRDSSDHGYVQSIINNRAGYQPGEGPLPLLHPNSGMSYNNRALSVLFWTENALIPTVTRSQLTDWSWFQGHRFGSVQTLIPAVRVDSSWYVLPLSQQYFDEVVRERGMAETVFQPDQMVGANEFNAQYYTVPWTETGWQELIFDGTQTTASTVGMFLGNMLIGDLPGGDITALGLFAPENTGNLNDSNQTLRLDSLMITAIPEPSTFVLLVGSLALVAGAVLRRRKKL